MSLNFPPSANTGDIYTSGNASYEFTGTKWKPVNRVDYTIQASDIVAANNELVIDFDVDGIQRLTLSEEATVTFANSPDEGEMKRVLLDLNNAIEQANTDAGVDWPETIEWEDGTPPTLPALTETALIELEARTDYLGTNYIGRLVGRNF